MKTDRFRLMRALKDYVVAEALYQTRNDSSDSMGTYYEEARLDEELQKLEQDIQDLDARVKQILPDFTTHQPKENT